VKTEYTLPRVPERKQLENEKQREIPNVEVADNEVISEKRKEEYERDEAELSLIRAYWEQYCGGPDIEVQQNAFCQCKQTQLQRTDCYGQHCRDVLVHLKLATHLFPWKITPQFWQAEKS
jgi:hypothetical protein